MDGLTHGNLNKVPVKTAMFGYLNSSNFKLKSFETGFQN
jgi:hypothetical protein